MKNLFNIGSSIVVNASSTLRITGPYKLVTLRDHFAMIETSGYVVEVSGEALIVEKLAEELAEFSFEKIERVNMTELTSKEMADGTAKI